jgi:Flp pilus assembly protein TadD
MAGRIPLGKPSDLAVMVRLAESAGLKAILGEDDEYTSQPEDVKSRPFQMEFERDARGGLKAETLTIRLESPDFDPPSQEERILVPPDRDSDVVTFLLRPLFPGELVVKLKVFARDGRNVMRLLRIFSEASDRAIVGGKVVVSIPLSTEATTIGPIEFNGVFAAPARPAAAAPPTGPYYRSPDLLTINKPPGQPTASVPAARKRSWVLPSAGGFAAAALVGAISVAYLGPNGATIKPASAVATALAPPPAPAFPSAQSDVHPPSDAWVNAYQKGLMHGNAGEYAAAVKSFQQAAQTAPEQPGPQTALAMANLKLAENAQGSERGKYLQAALEGANRAVALQADSAQARYVQGLALERNGQFGDAETALQQAVKLTPNDSHAWYALGLALEKQNKTDAARNALEQAVRLDPANADARLLLASILAARGAPQAKEQIEILKKDTSLSPAKAAAVRKLQTQITQK